MREWQNLKSKLTKSEKSIVAVSWVLEMRSQKLVVHNFYEFHPTDQNFNALVNLENAKSFSQKASADNLDKNHHI